MDLLLIQSQEHQTLPLSELKAVLETENIVSEIKVITNGLIHLKNLKNEKYINSYQILARRLGYTHEILEVITDYNLENTENNTIKDDFNKYIKNSDEKNIENQLNIIFESFKNIEWKEYINDTFAVRLKRFDKVPIDTIGFEKKLGGIIKLATKATVALNNPNSFIKLVISKNKLFLTIIRFKLNKKHFQEVKPHKRPFFYPGSMNPKLARGMVNLSKIKEGDLVLDPFCGTGGILIEAGLIGAKLIGSDINWKMKNGTNINLEHYGLTDYKLYHLDVREMKLIDKVDAVVTDPPYGISSSTGGENSENIFYQFLDSIAKNIKKDGIITIASPDSLNLDHILNELNFELIERHKIKMHKSLTRVISVITKKS
ncbi:MAG: TIGR01177 family methyltransferase [Methanobrevibacter sp.]|jgi:tRNA (guanine10-N2)-dimethyltransferase|nr:TIGR01177 family methyltransferase [Candidatus Methanovirga australis]